MDEYPKAIEKKLDLTKDPNALEQRTVRQDQKAQTTQTIQFQGTERRKNRKITHKKHL